jgi:hypothetical protein
MLKCLSIEDLSSFFSVSCKIIYRWFTINSNFINGSRPPFLLSSRNLCTEILVMFFIALSKAHIHVTTAFLK